MRKKVLMMLCIAMGMALSFTGCSKDGNSGTDEINRELLYGIWNTNDGIIQDITMSFSPSGEFIIEGIYDNENLSGYGSYSLEGNKLTTNTLYVGSDEIETMEYIIVTLDEEYLTLRVDDTGVPMVMTLVRISE